MVTPGRGPSFSPPATGMLREAIPAPALEDTGPLPTCTEARARAGGGQAETVVRFFLQNSGGHGGSGHGWSITSPSRI